MGYGVLWMQVDEAHIANLAVHPQHRRRGIGRALLRALLLEARRRSAAFVTLEVRVSNLAAQQLYAAHGFEWSVGARPITPTTAKTRCS